MSRLYFLFQKNQDLFFRKSPFQVILFNWILTLDEW